MGMAPWISGLKNSKSEVNQWYFPGKKSKGIHQAVDVNTPCENKYIQAKYMHGNPFLEGDFTVRRDALDDLGLPNQYSDKSFLQYAHIADSMQTNLEESAIMMIQSLRKESSGVNNLVLTGGVALNSVLNGKIKRELGFDCVHIPPAPGDEGIAVTIIYLSIYLSIITCYIFY